MTASRTPPLVTVIMATYNSSRTLMSAIGSVLAQDFSDFEIWVVGDACTDDSEARVRSLNDPRVSWINLPENSGSQAEPNNEGLRRSRGRYIAYLGHDDIWFPWHLSGLVTCIEDTGSDLVHSLSAVFSPDGLERLVGPPSIGRSYADHFVFPSCWLHHSELIRDLGNWSDHRILSRGVDFDFLRRVHLRGKKITFHQRLSLLKFPSWMWGTYQSDFHPVQLDFYQKLEKDPEAFEKRILEDAAVLQARMYRQKLSAWRLLKETVIRLIHGLRDTYGSDRWPLKQILTWRFQRFRKKLKRKRGLF